MLVGDSGYPLEPWLLTPVSSPSTCAEERYNMAHAMTRNVIERAFGLLKSRFRCLDKSGGTLLYQPQKTCQILMACCVLHNFCLSSQCSEPDDFVVDSGDDSNYSTHDQLTTESAMTMRKEIINRFN